MHAAVQAPVADISLDDYFDRLDAAFASLSGAPAGKQTRPTSVPGTIALLLFEARLWLKDNTILPAADTDLRRGAILGGAAAFPPSRAL